MPLRGWRPTTPKKGFFSIGTVIAAAFLLRAAFVAVLPANGYLFSDARHYDKAARTLLQEGEWGEKYNRSPLYPLFMAAVYRLFGTSFVAVRLAEAALGALLCFLVYQMGRRLFSEKTALIAAAMAVAHPHFLLVSVILYPTHLFTLLTALCIYLLLIFDESKRPLHLLGAAAVAGLAALTIPAFFFTLPFIVLWLLFGRRWAAAAAFLIIFVCLLAPWTLRNYKRYGRLTLVRPVPHTVFPNLEDLEAQKQRIDSGFKDTTDYLRHNPKGTDKDRLDRIIGGYLRHPLQSLRYLLSESAHFWALYPDRLDTMSETYQHQIRSRDGRMIATRRSLWQTAKVLSIMVMAPLFLAAVIGLAAAFPWKRAALLPLGAAVGQWLGYSLIYAEVRYRIPIEPYVLLFAAYGLVRLADRFLRTSGKKMHTGGEA